MDPMRRRHVADRAREFGGVLPRRLLRGLDVDRNAAAREVAAGRWAVHGRQTLAVHTGPLSRRALWWRALWEVGPLAVLDGATSLEAAGMAGYATEAVHVSVPRDLRRPPVPGVRVHRLDGHGRDVAPGGLPRTRTAVAAVRAAGWASSDRQAALLLVLPVQQRLLLGRHLVEACARPRPRAYRALVDRLCLDIADGAHSLGELDFAVACRAAGLPEPDRQVVRSGPRGRVYLDVRWSAVGLVVEIDGAGHQAGLSVTYDNLRLNHVALGGDIVLRIDLLGWRLRRAEFLAQVCEAHHRLELCRAA